jgi:hypothetical protein
MMPTACRLLCSSAHAALAAFAGACLAVETGAGPERLVAGFMPMADPAGAVGGAVRWWDVANPQRVPTRFAALPNRPRPFLDGRRGTAALWFRHDGPGCFWEGLLIARGDADGVARPGAQGFALSLTPSDARGWDDPDPGHFQRGRVLAELMGADGRGLAITGPWMQPGRWTHVAMTWEPERVALWVDGALAGERRNGVSLPDLDAVGRLVVGANQHQWCSFAGAIDEVAVWTRALAGPELARLAGGAAAEDEPALACRIPCDDGLAAQVRRRDPRHPAAERIAVGLPPEARGCFPPGPVPLLVALPPGLGACTASAAIAPADAGAPPLARRVAAIAAHPDRPAEAVLDLDPDRRGAFVAQVEVHGADGRLLHVARVPFASIPALPPASASPAGSPLGDHSLRSDPAGLSKMGWWRPAGAKWTRLFAPQLAWSELEPRRGQRWWDLLDREVGALLADGRCILFNVGGTPAWASSAPPVDEVEHGLLRAGATPAKARRDAPGHRTSWPPARVQDWEDFVAALAERYRGRIAAYECLNEPNAPEFAGTAEDYVAMLAALRRAVRGADPAALVVGGVGCPGYLEWTRRIAAAGAAAHLDVLSVHDYHYDSPLRWAAAGRLAAAAAAIGGGIPVWNSESGFPMPPRDAEGRAIGREPFVARYGGEFWKVAAVAGVWERRAALWEAQAALAAMAAGAARTFMHDTGGLQGLPPVHAPTWKTVSMAQVAAELSRAERVIPLSPGSCDAAGALIRTRTGAVAAFWSDGPRVVVAPWKGDAPAVTDPFGNPLVPRLRDGLVELPLRDGLLWVQPWPEAVAPVQVLALGGAGELVADGGLRLEAALRNPGSAPVEYRLRATAPAGLLLDLPGAVAVAPGGSATAAIAVAVGAELVRGEVPVLIEALRDGEVHGAARCLLPWAGADRPLPGIAPPAPGGGLDAWKAAGALAAQVAEVARLGDCGQPNPMFAAASPHWRGPEDCSFTVCAGWSRAGLHVRVRVRDDRVVPPPPGREARAYEHDAIEVFLDLRPEAQRRARPGAREPGAGQVLVCAPEGMEWSACRTHRAGAAAAVEARGRRLADGWEAELRLTPESGLLAPGRRLGLDVAVDDADDPDARPSRISQLVWNGGAGNHADPGRWGWFVLTAGGAP